jgi:hypothetical protein
MPTIAAAFFPARRHGRRKNGLAAGVGQCDFADSPAIPAGVRIAVFGKLNQRADGVLEYGIVRMPGFPDVCGGRTTGMRVLNGTGDRTGLQ